MCKEAVPCVSVNCPENALNAQKSMEYYVFLTFSVK